MGALLRNPGLVHKLQWSLRSSSCLVLRPKPQTNEVFCRQSHGYFGYRELNYEPNRPYIQRLMHIMGGAMWCYFFWSLRHNWRELVGEYIWPQRSEWSDQHLGIPTDDYD